jgi:hypothetical protein
VGVACTVFGLANVVSALAVPSQLTFAGIVIGSAWEAVGLKRGLPLFASTSPGLALPPEMIAQGLRTIRRRRLLAFVSALAWIPIAAIILPQVSERFRGTVFFLTTLPMLVFSALWSLSACPRCDRHFLPVLRLRFFVRSRCDNCGLGLHDA